MFTETIEFKGESKGKVLTTLEHIDSLRYEIKEQKKYIKELTKNKETILIENIREITYQSSDFSVLPLITTHNNRRYIVINKDEALNQMMLDIKDVKEKYYSLVEESNKDKNDLETKLNKIPSWIRWFFKTK